MIFHSHFVNMDDQKCNVILERLAKLEQKTDDLESFVKDTLLRKIDVLDDKMDDKINRLQKAVKDKTDNAIGEAKHNFKWMLELFVIFFLSTMSVLTTLIILIVTGAG